jgi:hypothetical protein
MVSTKGPTVKTITKRKDKPGHYLQRIPSSGPDFASSKRRGYNPTMTLRGPIILHLVVIIGFGIVCFFLLLLLAPNIEESRTEARLAEAYNRVCQISKAYHETPSPKLFATHDIPDTDPWGQPYRLVEADDNQVRALSSGPNMVSPKTGVDYDDIYADMPKSPVAPIRAKKKKQFVIATSVSAGIWLLLSLVYLRNRKIGA